MWKFVPDSHCLWSQVVTLQQCRSRICVTLSFCFCLFHQLGTVKQGRCIQHRRGRIPDARAVCLQRFAPSYQRRREEKEKKSGGGKRWVLQTSSLSARVQCCVQCRVGCLKSVAKWGTGTSSSSCALLGRACSCCVVCVSGGGHMCNSCRFLVRPGLPSRDLFLHRFKLGRLLTSVRTQNSEVSPLALSSS